jgi:hypothetical protein
MSTIKETVIEFISQLPDDITMDEIMYNLYVQRKVMRSKRQMEEGNVYSHKEVEALAKEWLK